MPRSEVFLDTPYAIALASPKDNYHLRAEVLADQLEQNRTRIVTTQAVLLEIGGALARQRHRPASVMLLNSLERDPHVEVISLSESLYARAFQLYRDRVDKEWSLTDWGMRDRGITEAFTTDDHFRQAGFRPLLLE